MNQIRIVRQFHLAQHGCVTGPSQSLLGEGRKATSGDSVCALRPRLQLVALPPPGPRLPPGPLAAFPRAAAVGLMSSTVKAKFRKQHLSVSLPRPLTTRLPTPWPPCVPLLSTSGVGRRTIPACHCTVSPGRAGAVTVSSAECRRCSSNCERKPIFSNKYLFRQRYRAKRLRLSLKGPVV